MHDEPLFPDVATRPSNFGPLLGVLTMVAAGVVYCLTRHPLLAVALPWLHGGWNTFYTGLWILRADPMRSRARTCFTFYLAAACWKAAAAAGATVFVFLCAAIFLNIQPDEEDIIPTIIAFAAGMMLNTLFGIAAVIAALLCNVRVWVQTNLRSALRGVLSQATQIGPQPRQSMNLGVVVVITAMIVPVMVTGTILMMLSSCGKGANAPSTIVFASGCVAVLVGPFIAIPFCVRLSSRVIAKSPQECWPPGTCLPPPDPFKFK